ncbi:MAG: ethanolamine permease [Myxococcaceae bacterium]|nr:ethanolamine permease [Myxococcaceae bacterium]
MSTPAGEEGLKKVLTPLHLWAIAVGLVISGDYFGWNYGVGKAGPMGMVIATLVVTAMYVTFIFSYTELSTAIPQSGGPFAYASAALGPVGGFVAGFGTLVEFVFAPPAIALAIGSYVNFRVPELPKVGIAIGAFLVFGLLNVLGVKLAATFELFVTALAALELGIFFFLTAPHVDPARIVTTPLLPNGAFGVFTALPFAIWFYLALEGVAMSAEEVVDPKRDIPKGYLAGISTLVVLALGTLVCSTGILSPAELVADDSPLPRVLKAVLSADHPMTHLMVYLGLFGLIASFHGIMMGYSRQVFALARAGYLPKRLAQLHPRFKTPAWAVVLPGLVGMAAVLTERSDELITLAGMGAVVLYVTSMVSLFVLRKKQPELERPFRAALYPVFPAIALVLAAVFLAAYAVSSPLVFGLFLGLFAIAALHFVRVTRPKLSR